MIRAIPQRHNFFEIFFHKVVVVGPVLIKHLDGAPAGKKKLYPPCRGERAKIGRIQPLSTSLQTGASLGTNSKTILFLELEKIL